MIFNICIYFVRICVYIKSVILTRLAKSTSKSPEFAIHTGQRITN